MDTATQNGTTKHAHGALLHSHQGGTALHWHDELELGEDNFALANLGHKGLTQMDRIEGELMRLHQRLDDIEKLALSFANGGGAKFFAMLLKGK